MHKPHLTIPCLLSLGLAFSTLAAASPLSDPDYEAITPVSATPSLPGLAASPLNLANAQTRQHPRRRFVMRDGTILIAQVLAFDGQMYALRLPHSTLLIRKDLFISVPALPASAPVRPRPSLPTPSAPHLL